MTYRARCEGRPAKGRATRWGLLREPVTNLSSAMILKDIWHNGWVRPEWAKLARDRRWMTWAAYYDVPQDVRVPGPLKAIYEESPFFRLLKREPLA